FDVRGDRPARHIHCSRRLVVGHYRCDHSDRGRLGRAGGGQQYGSHPSRAIRPGCRDDRYRSGDVCMTKPDPATGSAWDRWQTRLLAFKDGLNEFYAGPYRQTFARAARDEEDLFMMMVFSEALGVPNPATYYTAELMPIMYERFHDWHTRMGMEHSPLDTISCC